MVSCQAELVLLECGKVGLLFRVSSFVFRDSVEMFLGLITLTAEWANRRLTEVMVQRRKGSS